MKSFELVLTPEEAFCDHALKQLIAKKEGIEVSAISTIIIRHRSIDARKAVKVLVKLDVAFDGETIDIQAEKFAFEKLSNSAKKVVIVGSGPAGLFAALRLLQHGVKPIVVERGKPVEDRNRDIALLNRNEAFDPESNYAFGEGGAGTYSDGKLYTRSTKRGDVNRILSLFHFFGADSNVLFEAHPHIGTDRLPAIVKAMRDLIEEQGGVFLFSKKVTALNILNKKLCGVATHDGQEIKADALIWACGHSATDNYRMLQNSGLMLQAKGFALGVRIEHPQELINTIQYGKKYSKLLPPARYFISQQVQGRGVYSFCMCPGGIIVPALTQPKTMVVNGMSNSKRNSRFANAGLVVEIKPEDIEGNDVFKCLDFQQHVEAMAYTNGGGDMIAPAQALFDFMNGKISTQLPESSYRPGTVSSPVHFWLPEFISVRLREALRVFSKRIPGFVTNEAIAVAVESRTSSPIRIIRDTDTFQSPAVEAFFPCGEGSGYSGGIVSSAIDGDVSAQKIIEYLKL